MTEPPAYAWLDQYVDVPPRLALPTHAVVQAFSRLALVGPDRQIIVFHGDSISRAELWRASSRLAQALAGMRVRAGDRVAVMGQNTPALALAMLASWQAGAVVVPLNPMLKAAEVRAVLSDSQAAVLIVSAALWEPLSPGIHEANFPLKAVVLTGEQIDERPVTALRGTTAATVLLADLINHAGAAQEAWAPSMKDLAVLMYTSGTTGGPKGAVIRHRHLAFTTEVYRQWMDIGDADVILAAAPLSHITGLVAGLTLSLVTGAPLILTGRFDARTVIQLAARHRATFGVAAITAYRALLRDDTLAAADLSSLIKAYSGGAPVPAATVEEFERLTGIYIHPIYGLTETTSPSHATPLGVRAPVHPTLGTLAAGVPVPNTYSAILDPVSRDEVPTGTMGEVVIQGPGVIEEYWRRPAITKEAIPGGVLRTGDIGLVDARGWFYVIDRIKDVINTSGFKVWPREVEDVLLQHPGVLEAAVVGAPDPYRGETVVAHVVRRADDGPTADELIEFSRARLAAFKYPRRVEFCSQLPKTASGKILRRELREERRGS